MKKILILGTGAREHALGEAIMRSSSGAELFVYGEAKNPGLLRLASGYEIGSITSDFEALTAFARSIEPDFVIPGPEAPLAVGVVDRLAEIGVPCVGPFMMSAQLESSKSFTRNLVEKYNIPGNPAHRVFLSTEGLEAYLRDTLSGDFVIKADGLKGGKGVKLSGEHLHSVEEGVAYAKECLAEGDRVVVEEKLIGQEFSLMSFVDGTTVVDMVPVQDHKRAYVGDKGPNTGGMGSYSDANHLLPFLRADDLKDAHAITVEVAKALHRETGQRYRGVMYGGFMACKKGVRLIEYNARFGDPEVMNVLAILKTDFVDVCTAMVRGELAGMPVEFEKKAAVCKYVVPEGYPDHSVKGEKIEIGTLPARSSCYYASVDQREDGLYLLGSRAVAMVGVGETLAEAEAIAQRAAQAVKGPVFFREDIGTEALIEKRIEMMRELRG
jgi:phosphoribosylamine--glycine ligase